MEEIMIKNNMKGTSNFFKLLSLCLILVGFSMGETVSVFAATWQRTDFQTNYIHIRGTCTSKKDITVYLFAGNGTDLVYNAGVHCEKGTFDYTDELTRWNIPAGTYHMAVGEGESAANLNHIEDVSVAYPLPYIPPETPDIPLDPNTVFENRAGNVVISLQTMSDSIDQMITSLGDTTYSSPVKTILAGLLSSIKVSLVALSGTVVHMQNIIYGIEQIIEQISNSTPSIETGTVITPADNTATSSATSTDETASSTEAIVPAVSDTIPEAATTTEVVSPPDEVHPPEATSTPTETQPSPIEETAPVTTQVPAEENPVSEETSAAL